MSKNDRSDVQVSIANNEMRTKFDNKEDPRTVMPSSCILDCLINVIIFNIEKVFCDFSWAVIN